MKDQWDEKAEVLLQCCGRGCQFDARAVATALREAYWKGVNDMLKRAIEIDTSERAAAYLKGLEDAKLIADNYHAEIMPPLRRYSREEIANAIQVRIDEETKGTK